MKFWHPLVFLATFVCTAATDLGLSFVAPGWLASVAAFWVGCFVGFSGWAVGQVLENHREKSVPRPGADNADDNTTDTAAAPKAIEDA